MKYATGKIKIKEVITIRSVSEKVPADNKRYTEAYRFSSPEGFSYKQHSSYPSISQSWLDWVNELIIIYFESI